MKLAGFIGTGKMGGALACSVIRSVGGENVTVSSKTFEKAKSFSEKYGCECGSCAQVLKNSKFIFLGVKPQVISSVAQELKENITNENILVSMAAGVSIEKLEKLFGKIPIIRIMPNTPAQVGEGMILYNTNELVSENDLSIFTDMLSKAGKLDKLPENLIDAASAVSGCGPAFVYMFIEAIADGAVRCGLPRDKALLYAKQTVLGAAKLALISDKHPGELKDDVCSPGGTTIEGVKAMEDGAVRAAMINAVSAAYEKTKKL